MVRLLESSRLVLARRTAVANAEGFPKKNDVTASRWSFPGWGHLDRSAVTPTTCRCAVRRRIGRKTGRSPNPTTAVPPTIESTLRTWSSDNGERVVSRSNAESRKASLFKRYFAKTGVPDRLIPTQEHLLRRVHLRNVPPVNLKGEGGCKCERCLF